MSTFTQANRRLRQQPPRRSVDRFMNLERHGYRSAAVSEAEPELGCRLV